jgi:hypothetical protein
MPTLLSRIEREYILKTLRETLPAFTVLSGTRFSTIPDRSYACEGERIQLTTECVDSLIDRESASFRFCFYHRQRGVFFDLSTDTFRNAKDSFILPEEVYLADLDRADDERNLLEWSFDDSNFRAEPCPSFPLDAVLPDPVIMDAKKNALEKISRRAGIGADAVAATYRLYEYLEYVARRGRGDLVAESVFLYADHRYAIASCILEQGRHEALPPNESFLRLEMRIDGRNIVTDARIAGIIPVSDTLSVCCFSFIDPKEEDKRLLFERLYREKYR